MMCLYTYDDKEPLYNVKIYIFENNLTLKTERKNYVHGTHYMDQESLY